MPIPTRSQSVSNKAGVGIPTRQPSVRQQGPSTVKSTNSSSLAIPKLRNVTKEKIDQQADVSNVVTSRVLPKPAVSHARNISTNHDSVSNTRVATTRSVNRVATEVKKPSGLTQPKPASLSNSSTRIQTRSTSAITSSKPTSTGSRLLTPKSNTIYQSRNTALQKRPTEPAAQISPTAAVSDTQTSYLRDELLQLQLVFSNSSRNVAKYQHSANDIIAQETERILHDQDEVHQLEVRNNEAQNMLALRHWLDEVHARTDEQKVQDLSIAFAEVEKFISQPHPMAPLEEFESWFSEALLVMGNRSSVSQPELLFADTLSTAWRKQMLDLQQQVLHSHTALAVTKVQDDESGLGIAVEKSMQFLKTLLLEIETALSLERSIGQAESASKQGELRKALTDLSTKRSLDTRRGAWAT